MDAAAFAKAAGSRSQRLTLPPSAAMRLPTSSPTPEAPPVMTATRFMNRSEYKVASREISISTPPGNDLLLLLTQLLDPQPHGIPGLQEYGDELLAGAYPGWCTGRDDVARLQCHEPARVAHQLGNTKNHGAGIAGLHPLTIHIAPHIEILDITDLIARDEPRSDRTEGVTALALVPGTAALQLEFALRNIVHDNITGYVIESCAFLYIPSGGAYDDTQLHFPVRLSGVLREHHRVVRALQATHRLGEDHGLFGNRHTRFLRMIDVVESDRNEFSGSGERQAAPGSARNQRQRRWVDRRQRLEARRAQLRRPDIRAAA